MGKWMAPKLGAGEYVNRYIDMITAEDEEKYLGSTFRISNDCGVTFGPIYKCPVSSPHGPCLLSDGTILWVGRPHSPTDAVAEDEHIRAYKINPDDGSCEFVGEIENIFYDGKRQSSSEPYAIELENGSILCQIRVQNIDKNSVDGTLFTLYQTVSEDGGKTWTKPQPVLGPKDGAPAHIIKHSSGTLISLYSCRTMPFGIKAMFSKDNGKTWDINNDIYVNEINPDLGYPSTVEMADGSLLTVFYARPTADHPSVVIMQQRWRFEE